MNQLRKLFNSRYIKTWQQNIHRFYCNSSNLYDDDHIFKGNNLENITNKQLQSYLLPHSGHNVLVIQPDIKSIRHRKSYPNTGVELKLEECCALIESLPGWSVAAKQIHSLKQIDKVHVYGKGKFQEVTDLIKNKMSNITAVFLGINMLSSKQLQSLQNAWEKPIYDRYTIVLQIFKTRAQTKEAKLQTALAELFYYKVRIFGIHHGKFEYHKDDLTNFGGSGESYIELRKRFIKEREFKIKKELERISSNRSFLRQGRLKRNQPVVAVVGYTNAGKTSLIKVMSQKADIKPLDQLFATVDVTSHAVRLPNNLVTLFIDTVGFISDIPTELIASFSATLEDVKLADLIIHVRDISHPNTEGQRTNVLETLTSIGLEASQINNIVEVCNKVDLLHTNFIKSTSHTYLSTKTGEGLSVLADIIQQKLVSHGNRMEKHLRIPSGGLHYGWLKKEATISRCEVDPYDTESLLVKILISEHKYEKFKETFGFNKK